MPSNSDQNLFGIIALQMDFVRREELVAATAAAIERSCEFLGLNVRHVSLDREDRLETRERVRTSSYQQVAEPIYARAAGRWTRYRRHMEPLLDVLRPHLERYGYEA